MGAVLAALFAEVDQGSDLPTPLKSLPPLKATKSDARDKKREVEVVRGLLQNDPDKLKSYNLYVEAGYSPNTCRDLVFTPERASKELLPLVPLEEVQKQSTPSAKLGTEWKKRKMGALETVQKPLLSADVAYQRVGVPTKLSGDVLETRIHAALPLIGNMPDEFQKQVKNLQKVQEFLQGQAKVAEDMQLELNALRKGKEKMVQSQLLLKKKEEENVGLQVMINDQKKKYDQEVLTLRSVMKNMDREMVKNKMSLTFFKDWTMQLQTRMHIELNVLCEKNVTLQVDNNVLINRIGPLLALETKELEQDGEDVQGMLVS